MKSSLSKVLLVQVFVIALGFVVVGVTAKAEDGCANFNGAYLDRNLYRYTYTHENCGEVSYRTETLPASPNYPEPETRESWIVDCKKHQNFFQMESRCWRGEILEFRTYNKNQAGQWIPYSIRRLFLDEKKNLLDEFFLTDASGAEKKLQSFTYQREK